MNASNLQINLLLAWVWMLLGFCSGMFLGMFFHRENWLGGYASLKRRMYRLGHISFFGLGTVNLLFWLTFRDTPGTPGLRAASLLFIAGAVAMPLCCALMAHFPKSRLLFAVPVTSLLAGGVLTLAALIPSSGNWSDFSAAVRSIAVAQGVTNQYYAPPTRPGPWPSNNQ